MSPIPIPSDTPKQHSDNATRAPSPSSVQMATALQAEGETRHWLSQQDERITRAIDNGAAEMDYWWHTPDDREAEFRVYYRPEDAGIAAFELTSIDYRDPTGQERVAYEKAINEKFEVSEELQSEIESSIWSKVLP